MDFIEKLRVRRDLSLFGLFLLGVGILLWCALQMHHNDPALITRFVGSFVWAFGDFALFIPITLAFTGIILMAEASQPMVVAALSIASTTSILLASVIGREGNVGQFLAQCSVEIWGWLAPYEIWGLVAVLAWVVSGISTKRVGGALLSALSGIRYVADIETVAEPTLVQIPPRIVRSETISDYRAPETVIEAEYVDVAEPKRTHGDYHLPPFSIFAKATVRDVQIDEKGPAIVAALANFNIGVSIQGTVIGPAITQYRIKPDQGVLVSKITTKEKDIALALAAKSVTILAPIPGLSLIGIEVQNADPTVVTIREMLESSKGDKDALTIILGKDIAGQPITEDLRKAPHLLVAGATGTGKSVCLNSIISSLLVTKTPDQLKMVLIDPKLVELTVYAGIPHLMFPVITEAQAALTALQRVCKIMDERYENLMQAHVRNVDDYNKKNPDDSMPCIVVVVDEFAELFTVNEKIDKKLLAKLENCIQRIAQKARACGIHMVIATQRPSVDVITGIIKANIPARISLAVSSQTDSRTILDRNGAEKLLGRGDMLFLPKDAQVPTRIQGALVTSDEVDRLVAFWAKQAEPEYITCLDDDVEEEKAGLDGLVVDIAQFVIQQQEVSKKKIAARFGRSDRTVTKVIDELERLKVVGPHNGTRVREVLVGPERIENVEELLHAA